MVVNPSDLAEAEGENTDVTTFAERALVFATRERHGEEGEGEGGGGGAVPWSAVDGGLGLNGRRGACSTDGVASNVPMASLRDLFTHPLPTTSPSRHQPLGFGVAGAGALMSVPGPPPPPPPIDPASPPARTNGRANRIRRGRRVAPSAGSPPAAAPAAQRNLFGGRDAEESVPPVAEEVPSWEEEEEATDGASMPPSPPSREDAVAEAEAPADAAPPWNLMTGWMRALSA